ncbi:hypothetical protein PMAYCL1PPCAC_16964, partial [Pristionchus mayeri]
VLHVALNRNHVKLARLSDSLRRFPNDKYSLSLRVQLRENIWSIQKIQFGVVILTVALIVNIVIMFFPVFIFTRADQMAALQWCMWTANIILAICAAGAAPVGHIALAIHTGARPFYIQWYLSK